MQPASGRPRCEVLEELIAHKRVELTASWREQWTRRKVDAWRHAIRSAQRELAELKRNGSVWAGERE